MKRSKMITHIAKYLRRRDTAVTTTMEQCRYLAELMLTGAERKGMLPPPIFCEILAAEPRKEVVLEISYNSISMWEPENNN